ncbi:hypothetical protein [Streptomyces glaucescens]|uniref:Lipoprotein n=1 Tax=Streptomyces glaucescens TaxID=1907 RepID=A0A089X8E6_STRGA|nr:hypothetical protein [Streptomyces glaucescens]AIS00208.1 hypothetical protein SGLAU_21270 [Streptomyces glaucescens]
MKRSSGARLGATAAVSVLSLALITGCSESGSNGDKGSGSQDDAPAAKALSAAELKKLIIAKGDVAGFTFSAVDKTEFPADKKAITGDEKCKPLAYVMSGLAPGDAAAETNTMATEEKSPTDTASKSLEDMTDGEFEDAFGDSMNINVTVVGLSSYDGDGAEKTFESVTDAVAACAGGFTAGSGGEEQKITAVTEKKASGTGDESVAFSLTGDMEGQEGKIQGEVVRHGSTVATYYTMNIGALMSGKDYDIPAALIDAQAGKLK